MEQRLVNLDRDRSEAVHPAEVVHAVHRSIIAQYELGTSFASYR